MKCIWRPGSAYTHSLEEDTLPGSLARSRGGQEGREWRVEEK